MPENKDTILDCKELLRSVLENHFPELKQTSIDVWVLAVDSHSYSGFRVQKGQRFLPDGYTIMGFLPKEVVGTEYVDPILRASFGHELGHIIHGDCDSPRADILELLKGTPLIGKAITRRVERSADREAISRGLGKELLTAVSYFESKGANRPGQYYNSGDINALLEVLANSK